jgi:hypothetical protein
VLGFVHDEVGVGVDGEAPDVRRLRSQGRTPHAQGLQQFVADDIAKRCRTDAGDEFPQDGIARVGIVEAPTRSPQ